MLTTKTGKIHPENTEGIRCVIADDHELVRYGVRRLLEDAPDFVVVAEAEDAGEALKLTLEHRPDLVLLDIGMPHMNGLEVARRLRGELGLSKAMVVAMTGYGQDDDRQRSQEAGFNAHMVKPLDLDALQALLARPEAGPGVPGGPE